MIPELDDGVLPEGVHACTLDEVVEAFGRFQKSDRRQRLTETLRRYIADVRTAEVAVAIVVDGSYVTGKEEPADIDLILVLRPDFDLNQDLRPAEYNVQSKRMVRKLYRLDVLPAIDGSETYDEHVAFFSQVRKDDPRQPTARDTKGMLRIDL